MDKMTEADQANSDLQLATMMCACAIPFETVNSQFFKNFAATLRPAWQVPEERLLKSVLLDKVLATVDNMKHEVSFSNGVITLATCKRGDGAPDKIIAAIQTRKGKQFYAGSWDVELTEAQLIESLETQIIFEVMEKCKEEFDMQLYGVVLESKVMEFNVTKKDEIWYFIDQMALIDSAAQAFDDERLTQRLEDLLKQFQSFDSTQEILKRGGPPLSWGSLDLWHERKKMYSFYLQNLPILKQLVVDSHVKLDTLSVTLIFEAKFERQVKEVVDLFEALSHLEKQCDDPQTTLADMTEEWLQFEELCEANDLNFYNFDEDIFSPLMLASNFFHNRYRGQRFLNNSQRMKKISAFLMEVLSVESLNGYTAYKKREEPFDKLMGKKIQKWELFWDLAETEHPELAKFVQNLLRVPVTTIKIEYSELPRNHLSPHSYEKLVVIHHQLKIMEDLTHGKK